MYVIITTNLMQLLSRNGKQCSMIIKHPVQKKFQIENKMLLPNLGPRETSPQNTIKSLP